MNQPFYTPLWIKWLHKTILVVTRIKLFHLFASLFSSALSLGVVAVSAGRFLAIHLHLRYQELVTHKRVVAGVISIWVF